MHIHRERSPFGRIATGARAPLHDTHALRGLAPVALSLLLALTSGCFDSSRSSRTRNNRLTHAQSETMYAIQPQGSGTIKYEGTIFFSSATTMDSMALLPQGTEIRIMGRVPETDRLLIEANGRQGFVTVNTVALASGLIVQLSPDALAASAQQAQQELPADAEPSTQEGQEDTAPEQQTVYSLDTAPSVPDIEGDAVTQATIVRILTAARDKGNDPRRLIRVGDSLSQDAHYLSSLVCDPESYTLTQEERDALAYFSDGCDSDGSFTRVGHATGVCWSPNHVLNGLTGVGGACTSYQGTPLADEIAAVLPTYAVINLGTNPAQNGLSVEAFMADMQAIFAQLESSGVLPIIVAAPPRFDNSAADARIRAYNEALLAHAQAAGFPFINFDRDVRENPEGMKAEPHLTPYGTNWLNIQILRVLAKVRTLASTQGL